MAVVHLFPCTGQLSTPATLPLTLHLPALSSLTTLQAIAIQRSSPVVPCPLVLELPLGSLPDRLLRTPILPSTTGRRSAGFSLESPAKTFVWALTTQVAPLPCLWPWRTLPCSDASLRMRQRPSSWPTQQPFLFHPLLCSSISVSCLSLLLMPFTDDHHHCKMTALFFPSILKTRPWHHAYARLLAGVPD